MTSRESPVARLSIWARAPLLRLVAPLALLAVGAIVLSLLRSAPEAETWALPLLGAALIAVVALVAFLLPTLLGDARGE